MSWFLVGTGVGAAVGSYGHDNWGWSKDAIWQGAAVGATAGYLAPAGGAGANTAPTLGAPGKASMDLAGKAIVQEGAKQGVTQGAKQGLMGTLTGSMGNTGISPMMLGAAGLTLASASGGSSAGSSFQDNISYSNEGKELSKDLHTATVDRWTKAKDGDVSAKIFQEISNQKTAEALRHKTTTGSINTALARVGNEPKTGRGMGTVGGQFVKAQMADVGERMTGLFGPTSTLNGAFKEELVNAARMLQNESNLENQTAQLGYGSSLAKWGAQQQLASNKGAAIGSVASMVGGAALMHQYNQNMAIAS